MLENHVAHFSMNFVSYLKYSSFLIIGVVSLSAALFSDNSPDNCDSGKAPKSVSDQISSISDQKSNVVQEKIFQIWNSISH